MSGESPGTPRKASAASPARPWEADSVWRRRSDWQEGRIVAERRRLLGPAWLMGLLAIVLLVPPIWFLWRDITTGARTFDLPFFVFHAFAIFVFGFVGRKLFVSARQALRFEPAILRLDGVPVPIGGELRGTLETPVELRPDERVRLELACVAGSHGPKTDHATERTVWSGAHEIDAGAASPTAQGAAVLLRLAVAAHPPETQHGPDGFVRWSLTATLLPRKRWREVFYLPVFRTAESPPVDEGEQPASFREAWEQAKDDLTAGRLRVWWAEEDIGLEPGGRSGPGSGS